MQYAIREGSVCYTYMAKQGIQKSWATMAPALYDLFPGIYLIGNSIEAANGKKYYLWAGFMIEEDTQQPIQHSLKSTYGNDTDWESILADTPVITAAEKKEWFSWMKTTGEFASLILAKHEETPSLALQNDLFLRSIRDRDKGIVKHLQEFFEGNRVFEFMGLAEEMDGQYTVTHVMGEGIAALEGAQFSQGEGFLGRALLTGEIDHWENIEKVPRSIFFKRHQFKPKSLLCYPIRQDNQSTKLLFCGNGNHAVFSKRDLEIGRTLGIMLESHLAVNSLQHENDEQLRRLGSLIEICKLMVSAPDITKIAYILVDIGLNLVEGTFSSLILKETNYKIKLVSRGNASGDIAMYAKDVVKRYLTDENGIKIMSPQIHETAEGEQVIECPLFTNGFTHGVLSVGIANNTEAQIQEHLNFLGTLSIIGGVSLQLARTGEENYEENQANALYRAIGQFDPESYKENGEAANLAGLFAMRLGLDAAFIKEIVHACYLSTYEPEFIQELFPDKRISFIVKEGKELMENNALAWDEAGAGGQVFALVKRYAETQSIEAIPEQIRNKEIVKGFIAFIKESQVVEQQLDLDDEKAAAKGIDSVTSTIKEMDLSPREQEVLDLVIQGLNNKEIAQELYISGHTVKNHVTKIFQKLEVPDRAHAISKVYQLKYHSS